jgi:hypothetical protein
MRRQRIEHPELGSWKIYYFEVFERDGRAQLVYRLDHVMYGGGIRIRFPGWGGGKIAFVFYTESRSALRRTLSPLQSILESLSPAVQQPGVKVTNHFSLMPSYEIVEQYLHSSTRLRGMCE